MQRGPVQDRTVPLQRQQTLSTARRHSLSELFQLLHDFAPPSNQQEMELIFWIRPQGAQQYINKLIKNQYDFHFSLRIEKVDKERIF
jgi:hypothetical protein